MKKSLKKESIKINCPHCKLETTNAWICQLDSIIGKRYAYICGSCEKLLGISKAIISNSAQLKQYFSYATN